VARGAVRTRERALAPDLARGVMLLLIVLSNTAFHLWVARHGPSGWHPVDGNALDRAVQFTMITTLDLRVYPLFAFLFGYGMAQLYLRTAAGTSEEAAIGLLRRRGVGLIAMGFVHAALLMAGDILGAYGVTSLFLAWLFLRRRDRTVLVWCAVFTAAAVATATVPGVWAVLTSDQPPAPSRPRSSTPPVSRTSSPPPAPGSPPGRTSRWPAVCCRSPEWP
jgi:uncharacterized protein